jgi:hypothetical protein
MRSDRMINPGKGGGEEDPEDWGGASSERFREILFPTIADQACPNLKRLVLLGLNVCEKKEAGNTGPLEYLQPRVQVGLSSGWGCTVQ